MVCLADGREAVFDSKKISVYLPHNRIIPVQDIDCNSTDEGISFNNGYVHITSIIDNLLKGASGQAVQNMNLMFGFAETEGLLLKGSAF